MNNSRPVPPKVDGEIPYWTTLAGRRRVLRRVAFLREFGDVEVGKKVLEVGCGVGTFTERFLDGGADLTAIDISFDSVQKARHRANHQTDCLVADAMATPFLQGVFDTVIGSSILHHLNVKKALEEFWRVLRPGGTLALAEPNMLNPQIFLMKNVPIVKRWMGEDPDETAFIRWRLTRTLHQTGFEGVRIFPYDYLHPSTPGPLIPIVEGLGHLFERIPLIREFAGSLVIVARKP